MATQRRPGLSPPWLAHDIMATQRQSGLSPPWHFVILHAATTITKRYKYFMVKDEIQHSNGKFTPPSGLGRARLTLAISAGKLVGGTGRLLRVSGGTSLPGMVARRIDPN